MGGRTMAVVPRSNVAGELDLRDPPAARVVVVDERAVSRAALESALTGACLNVVADVGDVASAVSACVDHDPDVCLLDLDLPSGGVAACRALRDSRRAGRIVVMASVGDCSSLFGALCAGACGYVPRDAGARRMVDALRGVLAGDVAVPSDVAKLLVSEFRSRAALPPDERRRHDVLAEIDWRVLELLAEGFSGPAIASRLCLRPDRVRVAVTGIVAKAGARR